MSVFTAQHKPNAALHIWGAVPPCYVSTSTQETKGRKTVKGAVRFRGYNKAIKLSLGADSHWEPCVKNVSPLD